LLNVFVQSSFALAKEGRRVRDGSHGHSGWGVAREWRRRGDASRQECASRAFCTISRRSGDCVGCGRRVV